jgi:hypothetical protein
MVQVAVTGRAIALKIDIAENSDGDVAINESNHI